jgi:GNAT superfamily N-acetyltransferase
VNGSLLAQMHENYLVALERITVAGAGGTSERVGPWTLLDAGRDFDFFNVAAISAPAADPRDAVEEACGWFDARERPFRFVLRDPLDAPLIAAARSLGFGPDEGSYEPAMLLEELGRPAPEVDGLTIGRVTSSADIERYAAVEPTDAAGLRVRRWVGRRSVTLPGCSLFVGVLDGVAVARSLGLVTGSMVGIYNVYVAPEHRGRSIGAAVTAAAIAAGQEAGATASCLSATPMGRPLYERMGFKAMFQYGSYWPEHSARA